MNDVAFPVVFMGINNPIASHLLSPRYNSPMTSQQRLACQLRISQYFISAMMPESANPVQQPTNNH
jgi:hypothetical protein